jgi:N-hydroxyarylamine O-acetyltransferase
MPLSRAELDQYCERIGFDAALHCDVPTLQRLHHLHPVAIPFENLDSWLGRPVALDAPAVFAKLVARRRGGYCFEQNLLFKEVLEAIGFSVTGLAARVVWNLPAGAMPPRTHMLLLLTLDGRRFIADVGFGGLTLTAALELDSDDVQRTPHEDFRITRDDGDYILQANVTGVWQSLYRFGLEAQMPADYAMFNWHVSNHPQSRFVLRLIAGRPAAGMRHALFDDRYTRHYLGKQSEHAPLADPAALRQTLEQELGIDLSALPELEARMHTLFSTLARAGGSA